ncbi:ABC transporter ATP-binding protein [Cellulosilyticum lentocellum]|uniref:Xenobiotic-transporting ATPase n=1 Tax=Cellulosilyticum lentocellum (strain ATCC 49066 / DSM 5427 / NCIMB 11756 / RHM5) TaxID=642492 RepID=F2JNK6_CELLD|nr:ABC transporter ATP-binding protein [Cellulosilyticum lentocellum]ADZ84782.1 Xenobiotic-transporting ATPase [Cellulosilyticum lentocellum DSM 5427]
MSANNIRKEEKVLSRSKSQLIKRLLGYLKPYKRKSAIVISLMILVMLCNLINPLLLGRAIDTYVADKNVNGLLIMGLFLCACNLAAWGFSKIRYILVAEVSNKILVEIRHQLYTHIQGLSFNFFDSRPVGKILARIMGDVNALQNLFTQSIQSLIPELLTLVGISCFMLALNVKLALGCLIILPFLIGAMFYIEVFSRRRWDAYRSKRSVMNAFTHEDFSGIKVVEAYAEEKQTAGNFKEIISELSSSFIHAVKLNDLFWPLVDISAGLGAVLVYMFGYRLVTSGEIQIGTLLAFSMYVGMFWNPIMNLCNFYNTLISNFSAADRIFDILDVEPTIYSKTDAPSLSSIEGEVRFEQVSFAYDEKTEVLRNVNFMIKPGERIALVGPTGAGKTTIISLISRFYDPTEGRILIDGHDIKEVELGSLREQMGIMLQDTFLFSDTIMENIRYGKLDATDEEVIAAAKAVHAHDFIMRLEDGYQTKINERGSRLSLGQRQLLAFARALLANPRILILDEATSNIDTQTETLVEEGTKELLKGRTSFIIAHRLSTIRDCDKIMVINDLNIAECGTHEELIAQKGLYYNLYKAQYRFLSEGA